MKKNNKSIYFIKIYRRAEHKNVQLDCGFGAFSSIEKALIWLIKNKEIAIKEFANGHNRKKLFFSLMEYKIDLTDNEWSGIAILAIDLDGKKTEFFLD